jgi:hypothetical protein
MIFNKKQIIYFLFICLLVNLFIVFFISKERYIYYWDFNAYWFWWQQLSDLFKSNPIIAVITLIHSIRYDEYNLLPLFFLVPFNFLFGNGRLAYILSIANIFAIPSIFVISILIERISQSQKKNFGFFISTLTIALFPQFWIPILYGEVGVIGILIIGLIMLNYIKKPIEAQNFSDLILIGILLTFLILLRRWYAYWVVSFFIALIIERTVFLLPKYRFKIKNYMPAVKNIFIIGAVFLISFLVIALPIAKKMFFTDYSDIYSAYRSDNSLIHFIINFYSYFGFLFILLFILGFFKSILNKKRRNLAMFLMIQFIIVFLFFSKTQDFAPKHYYLLIPTMVVLSTTFIIDIFCFSSTKKITKQIFLSIFILILIINFSIVFIPEVSNKIENNFNIKIDYIFPDRWYPLVRNDISEINNLVNVFEKDLWKSKDDYVYILASSNIFNDDILRNACLSKRNTILCGNFMATNHVDKRDGFPTQFFMAKYVVITNPIQYHLRQEDQRVISIIVENILNKNSNISVHYKKLDYIFILDNNIEVFIYEKIESFNKSDLDELSQMFINYYPDKKSIFKINNTCSLIEERGIYDNIGICN